MGSFLLKFAIAKSLNLLSSPTLPNQFHLSTLQRFEVDLILTLKSTRYLKPSNVDPDYELAPK